MMDVRAKLGKKRLVENSLENNKRRRKRGKKKRKRKEKRTKREGRVKYTDEKKRMGKN